MENASNALMMAGGVLIGVIIVSIMVYAFSMGGEFASSYEASKEQIAIARFNEQFTRFDSKKTVSAHQLITLTNLIESYNEKAGAKMVDLIISNQSILNTKDLQEKINELSQGKYYYVFDSITYDAITGLVDSISFTKFEIKEDATK